MIVPLPVIALLGLALAGSALALAAFVWAVSTGQLDPSNRGGETIFEEQEEGGRRLPGLAGGERLPDQMKFRGQA